MNKSPVNILIVDDRPENIVALEALLDRKDIVIYSTTIPNEALKIAWEKRIDIALIDVQMPEMDGFELVQLLKANTRTRDILAIFVTAISKESKYVLKGLNSGAVDYLYKPLDPHITAAKVDSFIQLVRSRQDVNQKNQELKNFELLIKNSTDIICELNPVNFAVNNINPAIEKDLGYETGTLVKTNILDKITPETQETFKSKITKLVVGEHKTSVFEFQFIAFDGKTIWYECRASYSNKTLFLNMSDISPAKSYQRQLIKSKEAAESSKKIKEAFLANMSHELRTPIGGIIGLLEMLKQTELTEQQANILAMMDTSSQSLLGVINDVLDFSKIEAGKFNIIRTPHDVRDIVNSVYNLLKFKADNKSVELFVELPDNLPASVSIDSLRVNQILMNLTGNAINFTQRGHVKIKAEVLKVHKETVKLQFSVQDTGIGIAKDKLETIFESFEQANSDTANYYGGTGLGLAIVKSLVELMGGRLTVESEEGKGSTFMFTNWFDITAMPKKITDQPAKKALEPFTDLRILVAEDNTVNQFMLNKMLKDWKVDAQIVENGRMALDLLREKDFDLILMDTHMPELNGYETTRKIRVEFSEPKRSIPVISLSAATLDYEQNEALAAGMNDVLSKPFLPHQLHAKILKFTGQGQEAKTV